MCGWIKLNSEKVAEILGLYQAGWSLRDLAVRFAVAPDSIRHHVKKAGCLRSQVAGQRLGHLRYPRVARHWNAARAKARRIWRNQVGPIPRGCDIHHLDGDYANNTPENLVCLPHAEHTRLHWNERRTNG